VSYAEVLYDEIPELGYRGGRSILKEFMHPIRALANKTATVTFESPLGHQARSTGHVSRSGDANAFRAT